MNDLLTLADIAAACMQRLQQRGGPARLAA